LLERNTYIQRNGEVYEFLTNVEKDVEAEIKALNVDMSDCREPFASRTGLALRTPDPDRGLRDTAR